MSLRNGIQTVLGAVYPPRCVGCGEMVESNFGLCAACWRETPFIGPSACDACGLPLIGAQDTDGPAHCDDCMLRPRIWEQGRSALLYKDRARRLVLGMKHGDRHDIYRPAAAWMLHAAQPILHDPHMLVAPVPLHWMRLARRRYNQSALLAQAFARAAGLSVAPDLLQRRASTPVLDGKSLTEREAILADAITVHPRRRHRIAGRPVLIVDDVMTSGATLSAAARACLEAKAEYVKVLTLARVAKDA